MSSSIIEITSDNQLNDIINNKDYLVLDFYTPTCMPCKKIAPYIEKLAENNKKTIQFLKINIYDDFAWDIKEKYQVEKVPTFIYIKNNNIVDKYTGFDLDQIQSILNKNKNELDINDDF